MGEEIWSAAHEYEITRQEIDRLQSIDRLNQSMIGRLNGINLSKSQWDGMLAGVLTGTLIDELYNRFPELAGPLKDEIELAELRDTRRDLA